MVSIIGYDPYKYVSGKLEGAWTQLSQYKEYPCSVVLYNRVHSLVVLTPEIVLGAMLGTLTNMTDSNGQLHQVFGEPGPYRTAYMYDADGPRETPISSVIVLENVIIVPTEFTQAHDERAKLRPENYDGVEEAEKSIQHLEELKKQGISIRGSLGLSFMKTRMQIFLYRVTSLTAPMMNVGGKLRRERLGRFLRGNGLEKLTNRVMSFG